MKMESLLALEREWESAYGFGTPAERVARAKTWLPYYTYLAESLQGKPFDADADPNGFVTALVENGTLRKDDTFLDVGAGFGDYALRFAKHCREVTALELNPAGVDLIRKRATAAGIDNLQTVIGPWETFAPGHAFDVTFSSMCPAICNVTEIRRMERMTRQTCCIVTVRTGSYEKHRKAMMTELHLHPRGMVTDADRYIQVLRAMGRKVRIVEKELRYTYDVPAQRVLEQYPIYFAIFGLSESDSLDYLKGYLQRHADNGVLHDESLLKLSMLTWMPECL